MGSNPTATANVLCQDIRTPPEPHRSGGVLSFHRGGAYPVLSVVDCKAMSNGQYQPIWAGTDAFNGAPKGANLTYGQYQPICFWEIDQDSGEPYNPFDGANPWSTPGS